METPQESYENISYDELVSVLSTLLNAPEESLRHVFDNSSYTTHSRLFFKRRKWSIVEVEERDGKVVCVRVKSKDNVGHCRIGTTIVRQLDKTTGQMVDNGFVPVIVEWYQRESSSTNNVRWRTDRDDPRDPNTI